MFCKISAVLPKCAPKKVNGKPTYPSKQVNWTNVNVRSCPPVPGVMPETCDFWANEEGCHVHVKDLANRAEDSVLLSLLFW